MSSEVIVIFGAEAGILDGSPSLSERFADDGCAVVHADKSVDDHRSDGVWSREVDVLDDASVTDLAGFVGDEFGRVDHLVNVVGGAQRFDDQSPESIRETVDLNLTQHIYVMNAFEDLLSGGQTQSSVTVASSINATGRFELPVYSAAKAGLEGFVRSAANKFSPAIRVNAVAPGTVRTPKTEDEPKDFDTLEDATLTGELATSDDVVDAFYTLAVDWTSVTGQVVTVDAGQSAKGLSYHS